RDRVHQLVFRGAWELTQKNQITYVLEADTDSAFRFRGAFQTPSILAKSGEIRFVIGAEAAGKAAALRRRGAGRTRAAGKGVQTVTFFGSWKFGRDFALKFELDEGPGRRKRVFKFGGDWTYLKGRTLSANLRNERGKQLGFELLWTRSFALARGDGEIFARIERTAAETAGEAGARLRW
ncbi:MAG: hypothetical protein KBD07_04480, partial [Candidatus Omnitrophica bacterium]|nr:hypothetical protein [Candidatus Omnitrophota bacterium]